MAKFFNLVGRTEIIAAIYNPDYLASAILSLDPKKFENPQPFCLHSLRVEDLSFTEDTLLAQYRSTQGLTDKQDEEIKAVVWPFYEDYPGQRHVCNGCALSEHDDNTQHYIKDSEQACTMSTEQCA